MNAPTSTYDSGLSILDNTHKACDLESGYNSTSAGSDYVGVARSIARGLPLAVTNTSSRANNPSYCRRSSMLGRLGLFPARDFISGGMFFPVWNSYQGAGEFVCVAPFTEATSELKGLFSTEAMPLFTELMQAVADQRTDAEVASNMYAILNKLMWRNTLPTHIVATEDGSIAFEFPNYKEGVLLDCYPDGVAIVLKDIGEKQFVYETQTAKTDRIIDLLLE